MPGADVDVYYGNEDEDSRLARSPHGRLELVRSQELLRRFLPPAPAVVLDVGGGTGVHARWLAADGYQVHVVDPIDHHVASAADIPGVTASLGDARHLEEEQESVDAVLLLGPLYHLESAADRSSVLSEAARVLRPGGLVFAAGISRYASLLETGAAGTLSAPLTGRVGHVIDSGNYDGHVGFIPGHWHTAAELRDELRGAGFADVAVFGIEGPAWPALNARGLESFDELGAAAVTAARLVETDPLMVNSSAHLLAVARS
jgi:SAM-dependent methyltransferase